MAPPARKFEFVVSGSSQDAVDALRKLADAGKNTGGELAKAGRQLEKALGEGTAVAAKSPAVAKSGQQAAAKWSDAFKQGVATNLTESASAIVPDGLASSVLEGFGGAEVLMGRLSASTALVAGSAVAAGAAVLAVGKVSVDAYTQATDAVLMYQRQTGATVEEASRMVGASQAFGIATDDLSGSVKDFGENIADRYLDLQKFGYQVALNADGTVNFTDSMLNAVDTFNSLSDPIDRASFASQAFGGEWEKLLPLIRAGRAEIEKRMDGSLMFSDEDITRNKEYREALRDLNASVSEVKVELGRGLVPALTAVAKAITTTIEGTKELQQNISTLGGTQDANQGWWADLLRGARAPLSGGAEFKRAKEAEEAAKVVTDSQIRSADALERTANAAKPTTYWLDQLGEQSKETARQAVDLGSAYANASDKLSASVAAFRTFTADERASISTATGLQSAWSQLDDALASRTATSGRAAEAVASLAQAEADAAESVSKARSDAAESLADAERQAADRIADAQDRVTEARERATRAAEDAARRLRDARQAALDAVVRSAGEDGFEGQRSREQAAQDLADAEVDAARAQEDARKGVADAEQDLADTVADAARDRERAQRDAAQRIADAEEAASDRIASAQKAVQDAVATTTAKQQDYSSSLQDVVDRTFDAAYWAREHGASQEEVQAIIDTSRGKVETFAQQMGLSAEATEKLVKQLGLIPSQVELNFVARMDLSEFNAAMDEAAKRFVDPATRAMFEAGIVETIGGSQAIPEFAGGGMFRSSVPGGAGLAVLHDGEPVLTPQQQTGNTYNINAGTLVHERDVPAMLRRLERQGFGG
jgi:hypothetical protein